MARAKVMVTRELLKKQIDCLDESYLELIYNILCQFPHLSDTASQSGDLTDDPAVGMWKEREEMQDSTEWVRQLRHMQWRRSI